MTTIRTDFMPAVPDTDEWEPLIRDAIATAEDPNHAVVEATGINLHLTGCTYPDRTPLWDKPLVGSMATVEAVRADGRTLTIPLEDGHTWGQLATMLDDFMAGWGTEVMYALSDLYGQDMEVRRLEKKLEDAKAARLATARRAHRMGVTQYRIAKIMDRQASTVQRWLK